MNFENPFSGYKVIGNYADVPTTFDFAWELIILCSKTLLTSVVILNFQIWGAVFVVRGKNIVGEG